MATWDHMCREPSTSHCSDPSSFRSPEAKATFFVLGAFREIQIQPKSAFSQCHCRHGNHRIDVKFSGLDQFSFADNVYIRLWRNTGFPDRHGCAFSSPNGKYLPSVNSPFRGGRGSFRRKAESVEAQNLEKLDKKSKELSKKVSVPEISRIQSLSGTGDETKGEKTTARSSKTGKIAINENESKTMSPSAPKEQLAELAFQQRHKARGYPRPHWFPGNRSRAFSRIAMSKRIDLLRAMQLELGGSDRQLRRKSTLLAGKVAGPSTPKHHYHQHLNRVGKLGFQEIEFKQFCLRRSKERIEKSPVPNLPSWTSEIEDYWIIMNSKDDWVIELYGRKKKASKAALPRQKKIISAGRGLIDETGPADSEFQKAKEAHWFRRSTHWKTKLNGSTEMTGMKERLRRGISELDLETSWWKITHSGTRIWNIRWGWTRELVRKQREKLEKSARSTDGNGSLYDEIKALLDFRSTSQKEDLIQAKNPSSPRSARNRSGGQKTFLGACC